MKFITRTIIACLLLNLLLSITSAEKSAKEKKPNSGMQTSSQIVTGKVQTFMQVEKYEEMQETVNRWRKIEDEKSKKKIIFALLKKLDSKEKLLLVPKTTITSVDGNNKVEQDVKSLTRQDVFMEAGRSAWALERLYGCRLPEFSVTMKTDELSEAKQKTMLAIIYMTGMPKYMNLSKLSKQDKIVLAGSRHVPLSVLSQLASDSEADVRLAAAKHPLVQYFPAYGELFKDSDARVRTTVMKNMIVTPSAKEYIEYMKQFNFSSDVPE
ncbi:hypothetical protein MNBD_PLANCTO02-760 [hydrothermal vent metagenome]|uniref:Uncharacterized protein n=1 Tax=hydrothermal vent metagenome TaxID=652676 RepID=A0A3B1E298_9ZZZZ